MVHLYSTNNNIQSDEEFLLEMQQKEEDAANLLSLQEKADETERGVLIRRVSVETDLLSIEDGRLVYNEQKKKSFDFKHKIRKAYKDGIYLRDAYNKSEKFVQTKQEDWDNFDGKLAKAVTFSYQQLLKEYLERPSTHYE